MKSSLGPLVDSTSQTLILGTAPGELSLERKQYYANPSNQFWYVLEKVYGTAIGQAYEMKLAFLQENHLALWDVLKTFEREGSLDSSYKRSTPNDFAHFLGAYPSIRYIVFNGSKAQNLFRKFVQKDLGGEGHRIKYTTLPSTSSTPGRYVPPIEEKVQKWSVLKSLI